MIGLTVWTCHEDSSIPGWEVTSHSVVTKELVKTAVTWNTDFVPITPKALEDFRKF